MDQNLAANNQTPNRHKMSSSLKEKLRRMGRYHGFNSPRANLKDKDLPARSPPTKCGGLSPQVDDTDLGHQKASDGHPLQDHSYASGDGISGKPCNAINRPLEMDTLTTLPFRSPCHSSEAFRSKADTRVTESGDCKSIGLPVADSSSASISERISYNAVIKSDGMVSNSPHNELRKYEHLPSELKQIRSQINTKEEILRKLKLVKLYRAKNNLVELQSVIKHWRKACQEALLEFQDKSQDPKPSLAQLLQSLHIDFALVKYNLEDECFDSEPV